MGYKEEKTSQQLELTDTKTSLYEVPGSVPHCSLSKAPGTQWKDVGVWMKEVMEAADWVTWEGRGKVSNIYLERA